MAAPNKKKEIADLEKAQSCAKKNTISLKHKNDMYKALIKQDNDATKSLVVSIDKHVKTMRKISETIGTAEFVFNCTKALKGIVKAGVKDVFAKSLDEIEAAHREMKENSAEFVKENARYKITKVADAHQDDENEIKKVVSEVIVMLDNWTTDTWWFNALIRTLSGDKWNDIAFKSIGDEFEDQMKQLMKEHGKRMVFYHAAERASMASASKWLAAYRDATKKLAEASGKK